MGEGNDFHRILVSPAQRQLLDIRRDEEVLDIACGNGQFAREIATLGARVVAFDVSERMIGNARRRTKANSHRIEYGVIDATDEPTLLELGDRRFDAAVCTMALMDMAEIDPLLSALTRLLKVDGRFVFSVMHPCFNFHGSTLVLEENERDGLITTNYSIVVADYARPATTMGLAMVGQPEPQFYFHRPLGVLLGTCFDAGFALDGIVEPVFDDTVQSSRSIGWGDYRSIPPVLVARLRLRG